ncbi:MAG: hypothetical protein DRI57_13290 [Deltaproteobacteria bacterium]|nr:MAG: hypothetical protein DRI57_13290 [Deltaproteobacteria bacterium]
MVHIADGKGAFAVHRYGGAFRIIGAADLIILPAAIYHRVLFRCQCLRPLQRGTHFRR